jgi:hypothetical protein
MSKQLPPILQVGYTFFLTNQKTTTCVLESRGYNRCSNCDRPLDKSEYKGNYVIYVKRRDRKIQSRKFQSRYCIRCALDGVRDRSCHIKVSKEQVEEFLKL